MGLQEILTAIDHLRLSEQAQVFEYLQHKNLAPPPAATEAPKQRILGLYAGQMWTSEDFDDPLPDEFWLGEGNDKLFG